MGTVDSRLMTQADYARHRGCSREAVRKAVESGRISLIGDRIDAQVADIQWAQNTRTRIKATPPRSEAPASGEGAHPHPGGESGYWASRSRREEAEAQLAELKLAETRGELVRVADVRAEIGSKVSGLRESLLQVPARLAPVLAAESDVGKVHDALAAELRSVMAGMAGMAGV